MVADDRFMEMDMGMISYRFDDIEIPFGDKTFMAHGSVHVGYTVERAQSDCGYGGGVEVTDLTGWKIHLTDEDGEDVPVSVTIPDLLQTITDQISEHIEEMCAEEG